MCVAIRKQLYSWMSISSRPYLQRKKTCDSSISVMNLQVPLHFLESAEHAESLSVAILEKVSTRLRPRSLAWYRA
jgi:hypothetical protein